MEKSNEKSVYELLAMTASDSSTLSDVPDIVFRTEPVVPQQKKRRRRLKRHQRNQMSTHTTCDEDELILQGPPKSSRFCIYLNQPVVYCFGIAVILSWLIALTLLLLSFHSDLHGLDHSVSTVVAGSQGVPDALQRSLSLSKQLERNQTDLVAKFNSLSVQIRNFSIQISELHGTISAVQDKLAASPQVLDVPARLKELSDNVAGFGSTLNDLTNTVNQEKEAGAKARLEATAVKADVAALKTSLENVRNQTGVTRTHLTSVQQDLTSLTLSVSSITRDLALLNTTLQGLRGDLAGVNASLASSQAVMVTQGVDGQKVAGPAMSSQSAQTPVNGGTAVPPALPMPSNIKSVESEPPIPELEVTSRPAVLKVTSRSSNEQGSQGNNKPV